MPAGGGGWDRNGVQCWIKDREGRYRWVNRGFLLNYALERVEEVIGRTDHDLSPPHLADQYRVDDDRVLGGKPVDGRIELVGHFDRTAAWSMHGAGGHPYRLLEPTADDTELRLMRITRSIV